MGTDQFNLILCSGTNVVTDLLAMKVLGNMQPCLIINQSLRPEQIVPDHLSTHLDTLLQGNLFWRGEFHGKNTLDTLPTNTKIGTIFANCPGRTFVEREIVVDILWRIEKGETNIGPQHIELYLAPSDITTVTRDEITRIHGKNSCQNIALSEAPHSSIFNAMLEYKSFGVHSHIVRVRVDF